MPRKNKKKTKHRRKHIGVIGKQSLHILFRTLFNIKEEETFKERMLKKLLEKSL